MHARWVRDDNGFIKCEAETDSRPECVASKGHNVPFLEFEWADALRPLFTFAPADVYSEDSVAQVGEWVCSLALLLLSAPPFLPCNATRSLDAAELH